MIDPEEARAKAKELLAALKRQSLPEWQRNMADAVGDDQLDAIAKDGQRTNPVTSGTGAIAGKSSELEPVKYGGDIPSPNWRPRIK